MIIPFWKMHGAGNDFILFDHRDEVFPLLDDRAWLSAICARKLGIGSDGIILICPSDTADFRMRFINPDGNEVDMCGNGARCVARLAVDIGAAPAAMTFETAAGRISAEVLDDQVRLHMTAPTDWRLGNSLICDGREIAYNYVNTGVPHCVVECNTVADVDLPKLGPYLRYHCDFAPQGTNVDFIAATGPTQIDIRTYERGVENETLACGTGIVAGALIACLTHKITPPVQVTCASGDVLKVNFTIKDDGMPNDITLLGPTAYVFHGEVDYVR